MRVIRMSASFGGLERATLELAPGLNVLQAPNEGGKSTWAAFLRVMLYGVDTRDRDRKDHIADKNRYRPWSGLPMEGVLECEHQGRQITLRRYTKGAALMGAFQGVWTDTGEPVEGLTGENCGEYLIGVGREVFERSAFLGQSGLAVGQTPELERRIAALVTTGEEEVSFSQTEGRLREWLRRRKYNNSGQIPKLEGELRQLEDTLARMDRATQRIAAARGDLVGLERERMTLEDDLRIHRRLEQRRLDQRYARAKEELDAARETVAQMEQARSLPDREQLKRAQSELSGLQALDGEARRGGQALAQAEEHFRRMEEEARDPLFDGLTGEEAEARAREDAARAEGLQAGLARNRARRPLATLPCVLGGLALMLFGVLTRHSLTLAEGWPVLAAVVLLAAALTVVLGVKTSKTERATRAKLDELLDRYQVRGPEGIPPLAEDYRRRAEQARRAADRLEQAREAQAELIRRRDGRAAELLRFVRGFCPEVTDLPGCGAALARVLDQEEQYRLARARLEGAEKLEQELAAQGGQLTDTLEMLYPPQLSAAETAARMGAVDSELKRVSGELAMAMGEQQTLGDPARLQAQKGELEGRLDRLRLEYRAIEGALDALRTANDRLQARFSPELNALAGQWMSRLTGGKYEKVTLDRTLQATAETGDTLIPRPVLSLSQGTADQLYLAVRLAICQLVLAGGEPCPLVLDDALVNFDDGRLALALDCLAELGEQRQILLFTCHSRESALLAGRADVRVQNLQS